MSEQATFWSEPLKEDIEITGPAAAKLFIASSTRDANVFVTLRAFAPNGREVLFAGAVDPNAPLSHGWLRASHRKLDPTMSLPYRPWHAHDEEQPLNPGEIYELDIEIWPTSIVLPKAYGSLSPCMAKISITVCRSPCRRSTASQCAAARCSCTTIPSIAIPRFTTGRRQFHTGGNTKSYVLLPAIDVK